MEPSTTYAPTYVRGQLVRETWTGSALLRSVDYTYTGQSLTQEVRKVFDGTGNIVVAQLTISYSYSGGFLVDSTLTRNV